MKEVSTIGLDLAKNVFQVHGIDGSGELDFRYLSGDYDTVPVGHNSAFRRLKEGIGSEILGCERRRCCEENYNISDFNNSRSVITFLKSVDRTGPEPRFD